MKREKLHETAEFLKNCLCFNGCQTSECWASTMLNGRSNAWERMISCSTRGLILGFQMSRKHWSLLWLADCITALPDHPNNTAVSVRCCVYQSFHSTQANTARLRSVKLRNTSWAFLTAFSNLKPWKYWRKMKLAYCTLLLYCNCNVFSFCSCLSVNKWSFRLNSYVHI